MEFTNNTLDVTSLPRFEEVKFNKIHSDYWKVILIVEAIIFLVVGIALGLVYYFQQEFRGYASYFGLSYVVLILIAVWFSRLSFSKKGFAFREHDVLYRDGVIATHTMVIPYNRVQHVALHEGAISRIFGLAKIEIFTAGGHQSDIEIPGIEKEQAENIKQLLMGKIRKEL
ncbi:PH domain-containing protein [Flavobacterium sp. MAH-1]|uniref:PH domain-containing protein n=1 Tax=Flavobacterium agri TaxID=2743471 RepID=A0A7Y8XZY4_9FLAO|nr:PH domain-containing protein [Flavobacterium agri]NUY79806.1 PH domain-containing protein [Flavobacterium agri]NYA69831.1 PH domain-containing protein [Flavobacterium agri]